jgi:hypothetical protein
MRTISSIRTAALVMNTRVIASAAVLPMVLAGSCARPPSVVPRRVPRSAAPASPARRWSDHPSSAAPCGSAPWTLTVWDPGVGARLSRFIRHDDMPSGARLVSVQGTGVSARMDT